MPDRWAVATGNWSNTATWNGGTLPQAGDDVFADGFTVTIDQNVTVLSIRTTQRTGGTAGGGFVISNAGFTLNCTATGILAGGSVCLTVSANTTINSNVTGSSTVNNAHGITINSGTTTLNGNVSPGTIFSGNTQGWGVSVTGSSTLNMVGNVVGTNGNNSIVINGSATTNINVTGNVTASGVDNGTAHGISTAGTLTVTGNVTGGPSCSNTGGNCSGILVTGSSPVVVNGNCTGGPGLVNNAANGVNTQGPHGLQHAGSGTVTINGNCTGGAFGRAFGASNTGSGTLIINGNVTGGAHVLCFGAVSFGGPITVNGNAFGSSNTAGFYSSLSFATCILNGNAYSDSGGGVGFAAIRGLIHATNTIEFQYRVNNAGSPGVARSLYTGGVNLNQPEVSNVRSGIVFGAANEFTGTCAVPPAASVAVGVPVDNTVGTAAITEATIRSALGLASANLDTQLGNIATLADALPILTEIEASSVLAKSAQITSLQNNAPAEAF